MCDVCFVHGLLRLSISLRLSVAALSLGPLHYVSRSENKKGRSPKRVRTRCECPRRLTPGMFRSPLGWERDRSSRCLSLGPIGLPHPVGTSLLDPSPLGFRHILRRTQRLLGFVCVHTVGCTRSSPRLVTPPETGRGSYSDSNTRHGVVPLTHVRLLAFFSVTDMLRRRCYWSCVGTQ